MCWGNFLRLRTSCSIALLQMAKPKEVLQTGMLQMIVYKVINSDGSIILFRVDEKGRKRREISFCLVFWVNCFLCVEADSHVVWGRIT